MKQQDNNQVLDLIRTTVRDTNPTAQIILYGSRARGDAREDSDWDVIVLVDKPELSFRERGDLAYAVWDKGQDVGSEINVFAYTKKQWESAPPTLFKHHVLEEGILL